MLWNLSKFAECLIPLLDNNFETAKKKAINCLEIYPKYFEKCWLDEMRKKLGFKKKIKDDHILINDFFKIMQKNNMDFTLSFRNLSKITSSKINSFFENDFGEGKHPCIRSSLVCTSFLLPPSPIRVKGRGGGGVGTLYTQSVDKIHSNIII